MDKSLESEIHRRRFWACYLLDCHGSEKLFTSSAIETAQKLTLPSREEDFEAGLSGPPVSLSSGQSNGGLYCELIKAMSLW